MGFCDTITKELGIEWRRVSIRLYDDDECPTQQIFGLDSSVEFGATQMLRVLHHFQNHPDEVKKLEEMAVQEQRERQV